MIHSPELLDRLSAFPVQSFSGECFRATRMSLDPLVPSTSGGRWAPRNGCPVLYSSLAREGALAEISFYLGNQTPLPSKPVVLHRINVHVQALLRLDRIDLADLGVEIDRYQDLDYRRTQEVGAAVAFLEYEGIIVPSARWPCDNLILFTENRNSHPEIELVQSEHVEWQVWAREHGLLGESG